MNKYEVRTHGKKTAIVLAALELFKEKGFVAVSIKEIAASANVSQVSIYNYFHNKQSLVKECTDILVVEIFEKLKDILAEKIDFKEKLFKAFSLSSNIVHESLIEYFSSEALDDKIFLDLCTENIHEEMNEIIRDFIELGKQEGFIDKSISTSTILEFMNAIDICVNNVCQVELMRKKGLEIQKLLFFGLIGRE